MNSRLPVTLSGFRETLTQYRAVIVDWLFLGFGMLAYGLSGIAGIKLVVQFLFAPKDENVDITGLFARVVALAMLFLVGWGASFISIRILENKLYPIFLQAAGYAVTAGMLVVYFWGVIKCFSERGLTLEKYAVVLTGGFLVLAAFFLLTSRVNLIHLAGVLGAALVAHIFLTAFHYIFWGAGDASFVFSDLGLMALLVMLMGLMAVTGLGSPGHHTLAQS